MICFSLKYQINNLTTGPNYKNSFMCNISNSKCYFSPKLSSNRGWGPTISIVFYNVQSGTKLKISKLRHNLATLFNSCSKAENPVYKSKRF